jgi:hypothetical protein
MKNSKILFYSHFAVIASSAFLLSVLSSMPEAIPTHHLIFLIGIQVFAVFCLYIMHGIDKKGEQTNNNNEVSQ